jgi:hypothetical protein
MVVSFDDNGKNAKLSLRQTEILAKLNDIVNDISADCPEEYVHRSSYWQSNHSCHVVLYYPNFIQSTDGICWNLRLVRHIPDQSLIFYRSRTICDIGSLVPSCHRQPAPDPLADDIWPASI